MSKRVKIILIIVAAVLLLGGGATALFWPNVSVFVQDQVIDKITGVKQPTAGSGGSTGTASEEARAQYDESVASTKDEINKLIAAGGSRSIERADEIIQEQEQAAQKSGDEEYTFDVAMAKAVLLIDTGRAQEALDDILFPLEQKYSSNEEYKYEIYGNIAWAYRELGNAEKSIEYLNKVPEKGWD